MFRNRTDSGVKKQNVRNNYSLELNVDRHAKKIRKLTVVPCAVDKNYRTKSSPSSPPVTEPRHPISALLTFSACERCAMH